MKIQTTKSFFDSLASLDSVKSKWNQVRAWFKYHFNKDFFKVLKTVLKSYPWDESFLYDIEKAKIEEMRKYHIKCDRFVGVEYVIRDMRICESLIDIFNDKKELFHYDGDLTFNPLDGDSYEIGTTPDFKYHCDVKVNTKNWKRFVDNEKLEKFYTEQPHELYMLKAKYLYHKIRNEHDGEWWD